MTKLATIEKIHSIQPHFNADALEVAKIKEWPVVVKKSEYKDGQLVVFIQIDSIVPFTNPYFAFLEKQKYRIWNAKFRGAPSQGLVCPLSILPGIISMGRVLNVDTFSYNNGGEVLKFCQIGDDVTELLGITKYEKGLDALIAGDAKGGFPTHLISITDELNLLNYPEVLNELRGEECYLSIKADGSSMTIIYENGEVRVCSRRLEQKEGTGFWKLAEKYDLPRKLKELGKNIAIQAEACGGKIQGNPLGLAEQKMFVFNVKEHDTGKWYGWEDIEQTCNLFNIPTVQLVCKPFVFDETWTVARLQELANKVTYTSATGQVNIGEGIVLRPTTPKYSPILGKSLSVKIINQDY
jgi:RNA ligase (TIGR02306 family)